uniref:Uncharacterized protein n=1 Tax=Aegilops tauschii subsp. strangulata TaxID=200361 RepID=A0A452Y1T7_AEGTS
HRKRAKPPYTSHRPRLRHRRAGPTPNRLRVTARSHRPHPPARGTHLACPTVGDVQRTPSGSPGTDAKRTGAKFLNAEGKRENRRVRSVSYCLSLPYKIPDSPPTPNPSTKSPKP